MGDDDDRSSDAYHKRWEQVVKDEEAAAAAEDEALARQSDAALGLSAAANAPRSTAEADERAKRDALKAAKQVWRDKDNAALASKFVVEKESGVTRTLTQADLGGDKHAVHIKGARGCTYTLDALMRVAKVFIEDCEGCVVRVQCIIVSQHVEMWACKAGSPSIHSHHNVKPQPDALTKAPLTTDSCDRTKHALCLGQTLSGANTRVIRRPLVRGRATRPRRARGHRAG